MKKKGTATKALVLATIIAAGSYFGYKAKVNAEELIHEDIYVINQTITEEEQSVITEDENQNVVFNYIINEEEFNNFKTEKIYTLLPGVQLYDFALNENSLSPDTINRISQMVRGISTNGDLTLIEFYDGTQKYVNSKDIVEILHLPRDEFNNILFENIDSKEEYTVNKDAYVYNRDCVCYGYIEEGIRCIEIARTSNYSFVITENDEYFFIDRNDITLSKEYNKSIFKPNKKLEKSDTQLDSRNVYFDFENSIYNNRTIYKVYLDNETFRDVPYEQYYTLTSYQPIYFRLGNLVSNSFDLGIKVKVLRESDNYAYIELNDGSKGYVSKRALCECLTLDRSEFTPIIRNRNQITNDWDFFYDINGAYQYPILPNTECIALESNGYYTLIELEDGTRGYITNTKLIESENQVSKYVYLKDNTTFYHKNLNDEMEEIHDDNLNGDTITYMFFIEGEYAYIGDYYCRENYYVKLSDIDFNYNIEEVNSYGYSSVDTTMNSRIDNTGETSNVDDYDLYWIYYNCGEYSYVVNETTLEGGYVKTELLNKLEGDFYYVDLNAQRLYYYDSNGGGRYSRREWPTRTGNDQNPTHEGCFDIDWKAKDWEFTTYRGSYARYWIPFNEYGEGFHDLIGDDEENYGNEAYHLHGSHGCIRVPAEASEFIYNTSPVGTMVLVQRK